MFKKFQEAEDKRIHKSYENQARSFFRSKKKAVAPPESLLMLTHSNIE